MLAREWAIAKMRRPEDYEIPEMPQNGRGEERIDCENTVKIRR